MKDLRKNYKLDKVKCTNNFNFAEVIFITLTFGLIVAFLTGFITYNIVNKTVFDPNLQDIISTYKDISKTYYEDVDKTKLSEWAIDGMIKGLDEDYSTLLDMDGTNKLTDSLSDTYRGVGIQIYFDGDNYIVHDVLKNSSASDAGIKKDDIILSINNKEVNKDMPLDDITALMTESSKVNLSVLRDNKKYNYKLTIGIVSLPVVSSNVFEIDNNRIGYIYLSTFSKNSYEQFKEELDIVEHNNINSLIIDLRGNTGGYLTQAESIASLFIKKGKVLYSLTGKDMNKIVYDETKEERDYPVVILMNNKTASASEVLALSLKESYGATLIGTKSYGKGKVQVTSTLSDDTMYKYTAAMWYSPNGNNIDGIGIAPGIKVEQENNNSLEGKQLNKAIEFLLEN